MDELAAAARPAHCISCHHWMHGLGPDDHAYITIAERFGGATIERYQRNIEHYQIAPDLTAIARRLDPAWIQSWLEAPTDLRPSMDETMVRVRFGEGYVRAIVRYFAAVAEVGDPYGVGPAAVTPAALERPSDARIEEGRALCRRVASARATSPSDAAPRALGTRPAPGAAMLHPPWRSQ